MTASPGGLAFVPAGYPGAGQFKSVSWPNGNWYTLDLAPDGTGTHDITAATLETTIAGGPEGFIYVPPGSPQFVDFNSMLVSEFSAGRVSTYALDGNGDPIPATRTPFITGLSGAEGAAIDPLTHDFLFSTFGGGDRVVAVRGFAPPPFEAEPVNPNIPIPCKGARCAVPITCNLPQEQGLACRNRINLLARIPRRSSPLSASVGLHDDRAVSAPFIRFASAVPNTPPGATKTVRLKLTKRGKGIVKTTTKKILQGVLEIRNTPGICRQDADQDPDSALSDRLPRYPRSRPPSQTETPHPAGVRAFAQARTETRRGSGRASRLAMAFAETSRLSLDGGLAPRPAERPIACSLDGAKRDPGTR